MADHVDNRNQIFISYRRDDSAAESGRIYDRLVQEFGSNSVFKDIDSIPLGINFKHHIDSIIQKCDVVLVIIGQEWSGTQAGQSRLDNPRDLVRLEVEAALQREIPVIPVFINNASIESEESLPPSLIELLDRNGISIGHDPHFHPDMNRLIKDLKRIFESQYPIQPGLIEEIREAEKKDAAKEIDVKKPKEIKEESKPEPKVETGDETTKAKSNHPPRDAQIPFNPPNRVSNFIVNNPATSVVLSAIFLGIVSVTLLLGGIAGMAEILFGAALMVISGGIILALWRVFRGKQ